MKRQDLLPISSGKQERYNYNAALREQAKRFQQLTLNNLKVPENSNGPEKARVPRANNSQRPLESNLRN
jgi:hypothetical protein